MCRETESMKAGDNELHEAICCICHKPVSMPVEIKKYVCDKCYADYKEEP